MIDRYFFITLPNLNYEEAVEGDATKKPDPGGRPCRCASSPAIRSDILEEALLRLIEENPRMSRQEMADAAGTSLSTIERMIRSSRRIRRSGPPNGGRWEILN